jgi:cell division protein FtsA
MKHSTTVGIDIGTSRTRVVVCEHEAGVLPKVVGFGVVPSNGLRHGYITNRADATRSLVQAVRDAEKECGKRIKSASLAIGGVGLASEYSIGTAMITRADSIIGKLDIDKAIADAEAKVDLKNKVILHAFPIAFHVDDKELPARPEGIQGYKLEVKVLFITCFQQHLDDLLAVVQDAGIRVTSFTATPIATEQLLLSDLQRNFGCALIDVGAETVSVSVFENSTLTSLHVFGIGSLDITKDIALGLRVSPEEAESIKLGVVGFSSISKKKLDEIIEARLSDIFELIDKYFKKIGRSGLLPAGAILIGGGAQCPMIETVAKNMLKIPVKSGFLEFPVEPSHSMKTSKDQRLIVSYGVAAGTIDRVSSTHSKPLHEGEGFLGVIKHFFKQLMP